MSRVVGTVAALVVLLSSCAGSGTDGSTEAPLAAPSASQVDDGASTDPAGKSFDARDPGAVADVRAAKRALIRAGTGHFEHVISQAGQAGTPVSLSGDFDLDRRAAELSYEAPGPQGQMRTVDVLLVRGRLFITMQAWPAQLRDCWTTLPLSDPGLARMAPGLGDRFPAAVNALLSARGSTVDPSDSDVVRGNIGLAPAASLVTPGLARRIGRKSQSGRVDASIRVVEGRFAGLVVEGMDLLQRLDAIGVELSEQERVLLTVIKADVALTGPGKTVDIREPRREQWMRPAEMQSGGCRA